MVLRGEVVLENCGFLRGAGWVYLGHRVGVELF